jgi:O-antigen/teichoic acid export membrane protein
MSEIVNQSLQKIAKGTGIVFIGTIIGMLLGFVSRIIIVRYITQSEYGIYSLALVLTSIFVTISTLGLQQGATRYIAYFRGKNEEGKVRGVIFSSIKIALVASVISSSILFLASDIISTNIFHSSELSTPLKIFSAAIPFTVLITIFTSLFIGFERVEPNVYFQNILKSVIFILFLVTVAFLGLSFFGVLYAYLASIVITCIAFAIYTMKKLPLPTFPVKKGADANTDTAINSIGKELLRFSLPLLLTAMFFMLMTQTDTLMLGYFKTSDIVGLYNGAFPIAQLIFLPLSSMLFIFIPIASQLYSKGLIDELRRNYTVLTKWIWSATMPALLILLLFPETVLNLFWGARYIPASTALQILAVGFSINNFVGPNGNTMMVIGKTRFLMWAGLVCVITNVILNIVLIPPLGIVGASVASLTSIVLLNIFISVKLYSLVKFHPLSRNLLKPSMTSIGLIFLIYILARNFLDVTFWMLPIFFVLFLGLYGLLILLTKSFDNEDIMMLLAVEERLGLNLTSIKRILKRFVK